MCTGGASEIAEGHHRDERPQGLVLVVGDGVDPAQGRQLAQPEVPLLLAGAQEEVAPEELLVEDADGRLRPASTRPLLALVAALLELLEVERVVDVGDHDLGRTRAGTAGR